LVQDETLYEIYNTCFLKAMSVLLAGLKQITPH